MGIDAKALLPEGTTAEQVAQIMQEAAGEEVELNRFEDVESLAGRMVFLTVPGRGQVSWHAPCEGDSEALLARSLPWNVAIMRRVVDTLGGRLAPSDARWDGTYPHEGPAAEVATGPLTEEEVAWAESVAAYTAAGTPGRRKRSRR
jgi:hypothetical protein